MSAFVVTHLPRWFGWAFPQLRIDKRSEYTHVRDVGIVSAGGRMSHGVAARMAREWTLASACDAVAASGAYVPLGVVTLRRLIYGESMSLLDAVLDGETPPVVALAPRYESIYCDALCCLATSLQSSLLCSPAEIARDDRRAAYQAVVLVARDRLPRSGDEYGELTEQVLRHAYTGEPVDRSWFSQATAPASDLIDEAYRDRSVRLLYYLVRATDPLLCGESLSEAMSEVSKIMRVVAMKDGER